MIDEDLLTRFPEWMLAQQVPVPRLRRSRGRRIPVLALILVLAAAAGVYLAKHGGTGPAPHPVAAAGPAAPTPNATPAPTPAGPDLTSVDGMLEAQSAALLAGDQKGFLAEVDPAAHQAVTAYKRLYTNLRALRVGRWNAASVGAPATLTKRTTLPVSVVYCLAGKDCQGSTLTMSISVAPHGGRPLIEAYNLPKRNRDDWQPYPWELASLRVVSGDRVILAADAAEAGRLRSLLPVAERAAAAADRYALWGTPPTYLIFLADHGDARVWFGGMSHNAIGETYPAGQDDKEVVVVLPDAALYGGPGGLAYTVQHEMGHVATLFGDDANYEDTLTEGIAEYIAFTGHRGWEAGRVSAVGRYLRAGHWSGQCYLTKEITSGNLLTSNAAYGIGYLTVKYLVATYGLTRTLNFFADVERFGETPDQGAREDLGRSWKSVNASCAAYIHRTVHA